MTIKFRLFITFAILISLVVMMGSVLVFYGIKNKNMSEETIFYYSQNFFWREIFQAFDTQTRSLKYFMILGDQTEKEKFEEQYKLITSKAKNSTSQTKELTEWIKSYKDTYSLTGKTFKMRSRDKAFDIYSTKIVSENKKLREELFKIINTNSVTIYQLESKTENLSRMSLLISIAIGAFAILGGLFMSLLIFRSIAKPLSLLQKGTKIIGEGNLDYQLKIHSNDEIGQLAHSFNHMVQNLHNLQLQIVQMDRMSSIGQLAGGVAHEINNPLTGVLGQAQLLLEKMPDNNPHKPMVERIETAAQRCRKIVRALLDFARDKNYHFVSTDITTILDETLDFVVTEMESKKVKLINKIEKNLPRVMISPGHVQQVFLNIVNNAIHAMPGGGTLTTHVGFNDKFMDISFSDTGTGIKKELLSHVFDPFFTTKEIGKGTGLGLTISYGIIQRHNGEIIVKSDGENKGSIFIVRLPLKKA